MLEALELTFYSISHAIQTSTKIKEDCAIIIALLLHSHRKRQAIPAHKHSTPMQGFRPAVRTHAPKPNTSVPMPRRSILSNRSIVTLYLFNMISKQIIIAKTSLNTKTDKIEKLSKTLLFPSSALICLYVSIILQYKFSRVMKLRNCAVCSL